MIGLNGVITNEYISEALWMRTFAGNLRSIMEEDGISQSQLAKESGLSESMISSYINGKRVPSVFSLNNILHALRPDYNPEELFNDLVYFDAMVK